MTFGNIVAAFDLQHEQCVQPAYVIGMNGSKVTSVILNLNSPGKRQVLIGKAIERYAFYGK